MAHVINRNYSKFYDVKTRVQFEPVLDGKLGAHVAHALTEADFEGRIGFEALSDGEFLALISASPERAASEEADSTGDPVKDAASASKRGGRGFDSAATSDSRAGRVADGRAALAAGDMIDPESPAAAHASVGEGGEASSYD